MFFSDRKHLPRNKDPNSFYDTSEENQDTSVDTILQTPYNWWEINGFP